MVAYHASRILIYHSYILDLLPIKRISIFLWYVWLYAWFPENIWCTHDCSDADIQAYDHMYYNHVTEVTKSLAMNWFTPIFLLFSAGASWPRGISVMITVRLTLLRNNFSSTCRISSSHCATGWSAILLLPVARTVTSLTGMLRKDPLIWRAVLPGNS